MSKSEEVRGRWALGITIVLTLFIFGGFGLYRGFITLPNINTGRIVAEETIQQENVANVISPFENSMNTFRVAFDEIGKQYNSIKANVLDVFVPFFTSIDVYERK